MARPLILYHGGSCADGFASAWIVHRQFGDGADYIGVNYGQPTPTEAFGWGRRVFVLDFSYPREELLKIAETNNRLIVIDHHGSAKAELEGLQFPGLTVVFDLTKSGAMLTWEFFYPNQPPPFIVSLVQDRDLWRWAIPSSRELSAYIASLPHSFETWDQIAGDLHAPRWVESGVEGIEGQWVFDGNTERAIEQGAAILRYQRQQVESQAKNAVEVEIDGHKVLAVNATLLISEIAGKLAENRPFGCTWFQRSSDGKFIYSLRSDKNGVDVSEVARKFNGGGHVQAAGFELGSLLCHPLTV